MAEVGLSLPCSNAWRGRGGSVINITKTKFHNHLSNQMLNALMHVSINAPESSKCGDVVKAAIDHWLKQKPRRKLKRAAASSKPEVNLESSQVQVPERETLNTLEEIEESDDLKGAEVAILEEPEESLHEIEAAAAEEEAATFATAIELPEPDLDYDSAIESDFESEDEF